MSQFQFVTWCENFNIWKTLVDSLWERGALFGFLESACVLTHDVHMHGPQAVQQTGKLDIMPQTLNRAAVERI